MELTKESIQSKNFIRNYENNMIYIGESCYKHDILISNNSLVKWELDNISNLSLDDLSDLFKLNPEIIITSLENPKNIPRKSSEIPEVCLDASRIHEISIIRFFEDFS